MSHRFAIAAVSVALLSLAYFLFADGESISIDVPIDSFVVTNDASDNFVSWRLPDSLRRIASGKTPRRDASFLFYRQQLVPLEYPFDAVDTVAHRANGWHRVRDGFLELSLRPEIELRPGDLEFELNGPMSGSRQVAWAVLVVACLVVALIGSPWSTALLSGRSVVILAFLAPAIVITSFLSMLYFPLPPQWQSTRLGLAFDRLDAVLPGLILLVAVCGYVSDRRTGDPIDRVLGKNLFLRSGWLAAISIVMLSFVRMSSWGPGATAAWSPVETSSPFASSIAYSDAEGYLAGVYRLLTTGTLDQWNQRRPINAALLATRLAISGGNVDIAKWLQAITVGIAVAWLSREVARLFGWRSAVAAIALLVGCGRLFLITTLSEPLGFTLGCLAMVGLLRQLRCKCFVSGLAGLGLMALAQGARPGALFVLPAIGFWVARVASGEAKIGVNRWRRRVIVFGITGMVGGLALAVNPMLSRIYGTDENLTGSNFAHTFLALATGQSWDEAVQEYQSQIDQQPNEKAVALFLYREGLRQIGQQPQVFVGQLAKGLGQFAIETPRFLTAITARSTTDSLFPLLWLQVLAMTMLVAAAAWRTVGLWQKPDDDDQQPGDIQSRQRSEFWLWMLIALGIASSIPFVFLDGGLRVLIATWPAVLIWIASSLAGAPVDTLSVGNGRKMSNDSSRWWLVGLLGGIVVVAAIGPMLSSRLAGYSARNRSANGSNGIVSIDRRLIGPGLWVGGEEEATWSSVRSLSATGWMRAWQRSGIGNYRCLATLHPSEVEPDERALFVQIFSPGDDRTRVLMVPEAIANELLGDDAEVDVIVRWCDDWPMVGRVIGKSRSETLAPGQTDEASDAQSD